MNEVLQNLRKSQTKAFQIGNRKCYAFWHEDKIVIQTGMAIKDEDEIDVTAQWFYFDSPVHAAKWVWAFLLAPTPEEPWIDIASDLARAMMSDYRDRDRPIGYGLIARPEKLEEFRYTEILFIDESTNIHVGWCKDWSLLPQKIETSVEYIIGLNAAKLVVE